MWQARSRTLKACLSRAYIETGGGGEKSIDDVAGFLRMKWLTVSNQSERHQSIIFDVCLAFEGSSGVAATLS
jgi:hypothetical protein